MKLFIDDLRDAPDDSWTVVRTSDEALGVLRSILGAQLGAYPYGPDETPLEAVSFDHDLGGEDTTRPVMLWMCEFGLWPDSMRVHSMNPVGKSWLLNMADHYAPEGVVIEGVWRG